MVGRWPMIGHFYLKTARAVPHRHSQETGIKVRFNAFVVVSSRFEKKVHRFYRWFKNTSARKVFERLGKRSKNTALNLKIVVSWS